MNAKQNFKIGRTIWHGLILASLFLPIFVSSVIWPHWVFTVAGHEGAIAAEEALYFRYVSLGSIAHVYSGVLSSFFIGTGRTRVVMCVDIFVASLNVFLDWLLIFGFSVGTLLTLGPLGIKGAAIATATALSIKTLIFLVLVFQRSNREKFGT